MIVKGEVKSIGIVDIRCDRCGYSTKKECGFEYARLEASWGYNSSKDGEQHELDLCEPCYDWLRALLLQAGVVVRVQEYHF